jgi:hypothetical protein
MSDLINVADYDRIADIFGFDDETNPLFNKPQKEKESDEDVSER